MATCKSTTSMIQGKALTLPSRAAFKPCAVVKHNKFCSAISTTPAQRSTTFGAGSRAMTQSRFSVTAQAGIDALIFDCDGVIVESEDIHRRAYNSAFQEFNVICPGQSGPIDWTVEFYDMLQNKVGGGKPKMRWYFGENGWPTSSILNGRAPENGEEGHLLVDTLQDFKTDKYKDIIGSGEIKPRPGVIELMDSARAAGVPVAVCSAATKAAVDFVLPNLLGQQRFQSLDLYMAGDDVPLKKPDPTIYKVAAERLKVDPAKCLVVEDSIVGLKAALGAGMKCVITYTTSTASQEFEGATSVFESLDNVEFERLSQGKLDGQDDRVAAAVSAKTA